MKKLIGPQQIWLNSIVKIVGIIDKSTQNSYTCSGILLSLNVTKPIWYLRVHFASFNRIRLTLSPDHTQKNMFAFIFFIITNYNKPLVADKRILQFY